MTAIFRLTLFLNLVLLPVAPATAVCSGAPIEQEFREADLVVRARVVAETRVTDDEPSDAYRAQWGEYSPVVLNRLRVLEVFKGRPGATIAAFQEISSGRFDLDIGEDYLLFLHYHRPYPGSGSVIRGSVYVKYACGHSKPWREARGQDIAYLRSMVPRR